MKEENKMQKNTLQRKTFKILGISIWRILAYFIIYSVLGYVIETLFSIMTKGTWESRQSFLYGPFCSIYGLGAVIMIVFLQYFNKNNNTLFFGGFIIGSITEYVISFLGEKLFHVIWWDYSNMPLNLNGRICVFFSLFWGFLAIYLMSYANPRIDRLIDKIKKKISLVHLKILTTAVIIFLFFDFLLTGFAINMFYIRMIHEHDLQVANREQVEVQYEKIYGNETMSKWINTFFSNKKMLRTFPNLKAMDKDGNIIYFDGLLPEITPYYYKFKTTVKNQLESILKGERT